MFFNISSLNLNLKKYRLPSAGILLLGLFVFLPVFKSWATENVNAKEIINLTNQARLEQSLPTLKINHLLTKAAEAKAKAIVKSQFFSHNAPDGKKFSDWVKEVDYHYVVVGENLAMGFGSSEAVVEAWLNSPMHRANILKTDYQEIGLVVVKGKMEGQETYVIVQYFGGTANQLLSENLFGEFRVI